MPFMKGPEPIRRTIRYLQSGKIVLRNFVKILTINYNTIGEHHQGTREFVFWHLPQLQYKNPEVQIITFRNMTPTPFIRCFFDNGDEIVMDIFSKERQEIHDHLRRILGKTNEVLAEEAKVKEQKTNPANMGADCTRHCICEIPGQVPCPNLVLLPKSIRGKYKFAQS